MKCCWEFKETDDSSAERFTLAPSCGARVSSLVVLKRIFGEGVKNDVYGCDAGCHDSTRDFPSAMSCGLIFFSSSFRAAALFGLPFFSPSDSHMNAATLSCFTPLPAA
jgi:hypothetical protein